MGERSGGAATHDGSSLGRGKGDTPVAKLASVRTMTTIRKASAIFRAVIME